ncbi:MAG: hypothetical protein H7315_17625 [Herminiimonas sp.]|nr:hypothetical protein [Herminiimonas sp.]
MKERFEKLITAFCAAIELPCPERMIGGTPFSMNQVVCSISCRSHGNDNLLLIHIDFGEVTKEAEAVIFYALLRDNFLDFSLKNCSFGISGLSGHIVYASSYSIDIMTPDSLLAALTTLTWQAKLWRTNHATVQKNSITGALTHRPHFLSATSNGMP